MEIPNCLLDENKQETKPHLLLEEIFDMIIPSSILFFSFFLYLCKLLIKTIRLKYLFLVQIDYIFFKDDLCATFVNRKSTYRNKKRKKNILAFLKARAARDEKQSFVLPLKVYRYFSLFRFFSPPRQSEKTICGGIKIRSNVRL